MKQLRFVRLLRHDCQKRLSYQLNYAVIAPNTKMLFICGVNRHTHIFRDTRVAFSIHAEFNINIYADRDAILL